MTDLALKPSCWIFRPTRRVSRPRNEFVTQADRDLSSERFLDTPPANCVGMASQFPRPVLLILLLVFDALSNPQVSKSLLQGTPDPNSRGLDLLETQAVPSSRKGQLTWGRGARVKKLHVCLELPAAFQVSAPALRDQLLLAGRVSMCDQPLQSLRACLPY